MSRLADMIDARSDELALRFAERAYSSGAALSLSRDEVVNGLKSFLHELADAIRIGTPRARDAGAKSEPARAHGRQRFELGYDVGAVIREYGIIADLLFDLVDELGAPVTDGDRRALSQFLIGSISSAATGYGASKDEELRVHAGEHIAFLAHELRNPLSSARMALGLLRERGDLKRSRASDALERSLLQLGVLVDDALVDFRLKAAASMHIERIEFHPLVTDLVNETTPEVEAKQLTVTVEGSAEVSA